MRILITGGAGFIGQYTARALTGRGHSVTALDVLSSQVHDDALDAASRFPGPLVIGDVTDRRVWEALAPHDVIIHAAAETGTAQSMYEADRYRRVNVEGTRMAAECAVTWNAPLVSLSSRAVYGEGHPTVATTEATAHAPVSEYGSTKSEAEGVAWSVMNAGPPLSIVRPQNVIGYGQALSNPYTGVLSAFLARLRDGKPLIVYGSGEQTRDFVHVADVATLLVWLAENPPEPGEPLILNSGSGIRITLNELAAFAVAASPIDPGPTEHVDVHRAGDIDHAAADLTRLLAVGAPRPQVTPREAVADFIQRSWGLPGVDSMIWDDALDELRSRGLAE